MSHSYDGLIGKLDYVYQGFWKEHGSKGFDHLPLLNEGPWKVLAMVALYLWFVNVKGPAIMKNRQPMNVKPYMMAYNVFLVLLHVCLFPFGVWASDYFVSPWECKILATEYGPGTFKDQVIIALGYTYFMTKFIEMLDTVFFILRKKTNQVTTLHVFHHSVMPIFCYLAGKFSPWYPIGWTGLLNAFVHIVMYSYYTVALMDIKSLLWMKKYITQLQLIQFVLIFVHSVYFLSLPAETCKWPKIFPTLQLLQSTMFLYMFSSFYYGAYIKKRPTKVVQEKKHE